MENKNQEDKLAEFTDTLLEGKNMRTSEIPDVEKKIVRSLNRVISPDAEPDPAFRERLNKRLNDEWKRRSQGKVIPFRRRRLLFNLAVAAAILIIAGVFLQNPINNDPPTGTAANLELTPETIVGIVVFVVVGAISGIILYYRQQKR